MNNENFNKEDEKNIIKFLNKESLLKDDKYIIVHEKLMGFSNDNYIINITDKLTGKILKKYVYRKFGKVSSEYNKSLEIKLITYLFNKGIGPNLLYEDKNYRISEFLYDCTNLPLNNLFDEYIINSIIKILITYSSICLLYNYQFINNKILLNPINNNEINKIKCENIHYNNIMEIFYKKAIESFNIFEKKFYKNIDNNLKYDSFFKKISELFRNCQNFYEENIPTEGILTLNHNDCFSLNLMIREKDKKIFLIDNEYAALNFLGYDITYYICESHFDYENIYNYTIPKIDIDKCFNDYYMKYINEFESINKDNLKNFEKIIDEVKNKKYYIKLSLLTNLFLFIYLISGMDYEKWEINKDKDFYFTGEIYRVNLYNFFKKELDQI